MTYARLQRTTQYSTGCYRILNIILKVTGEITDAVLHFVDKKPMPFKFYRISSEIYICVYVYIYFVCVYVYIHHIHINITIQNFPVEAVCCLKTSLFVRGRFKMVE